MPAKVRVQITAVRRGESREWCTPLRRVNARLAVLHIRGHMTVLTRPEPDLDRLRRALNRVPTAASAVEGRSIAIAGRRTHATTHVVVDMSITVCGGGAPASRGSTNSIWDDVLDRKRGRTQSSCGLWAWSSPRPCAAWPGRGLGRSRLRGYPPLPGSASRHPLPTPQATSCRNSMSAPNTRIY